MSRYDYETHPLTDPPDRDLDPPEPSDEDLRREKLRMEWERMQEEEDEHSS